MGREGTRGCGGLCSGVWWGPEQRSARASAIWFFYSRPRLLVAFGWVFPSRLMPLPARGRGWRVAAARVRAAPLGRAGGKWELVADSARRGREGLIGALVLEFGKLRGPQRFGIWNLEFGIWNFHISAGIKERGCVGFHSDNDNPKFTAILDATGGSESEKK